MERLDTNTSFLELAFQIQRKEDHCEFEAYMINSRPDEAMWIDPHLKKTLQTHPQLKEGLWPGDDEQ